MTNEYNQYLEQYNQIVSNKLKTKGVYELIELWNKTEDTRFKNLAKEIIREIYVDLYNITNKRHSDYMKDNLYSNDYYSKKTQNKLEMLDKLTLHFNMKDKYQELWYLMHKLEIEK